MEKDMNETMANNGLQIIKHPSYQTYGKRLLSWFDIRVFYVRVSNFMVDGYTPEYLTLNHIPLDPDTVLEVNSRRCSLQSEGSSCRLKRNRVDKKFEEATFVSTDNIRLSGSVKFEVFDGEELVLSGTLENEKDGDVGKWRMSCESMMCNSNGFLKGKQTVIEVYVAGSFIGTPIILTKTLQISVRKKQNRNGMLDSIPEYETNESQMAGYRHYKAGNQENYESRMYKAGNEEYYGSSMYKAGNEENYENSMFWGNAEYMEGEDGALSWFNAGVRVGVGIGLGVCLGAGIGVGLLVRTYQSTTRNFRRRF